MASDQTQLLQDLPGILSRHSRMLALQNSGGDIESFMNKMTNSGSIADANKRQQSWMSKPSLPDEPQPESGEPFLMAQMGSSRAQDQMDQSNADLLRGKSATQASAAATAHAQVNQPLPGIVPAGTYEKQNLDTLRAEQSRIEQKLSGKKAAPANETEDQRNRRLHPELY